MKNNLKRTLAMILVLVISVCAFTGCSTGYKGAIETCMELMNGNPDNIMDVAPQALWDWIEKEDNLDLDKIKDAYAEYNKEITDNLKDKYGSDYKVTYKITDKDKLDKDDLDELKDELKDIGIAKKTVSSAYELELEVTIKGEEDKDSDSYEVYAVKIDDKWYLYDEDSANNDIKGFGGPFALSSSGDLIYYPYGKDSYLIVSSDRTSVKNAAGAEDFSRLMEFCSNFQNGKEDSIRIVTTFAGYPVTEDVVIVKEGDRVKIVLTLDNTQNPLLSQADPIVSISYDRIDCPIISGVRRFTLQDNKGVTYTLAKQTLYY